MTTTAADASRDVMLTAVFVGLWFAMTLFGYWDNWASDLSGLYLAGHYYAIGDYAGVYAAPEGFFGPGVESWAATLKDMGVDGDVDYFPYVYPPLWAALIAPVTQVLGPQAFINLFYIIQIGMMAAAIPLSYRILTPPLRSPIYAAILCVTLSVSIIAINALFLNQIQITVSFLILLAFERYRSGKMIQAGLVLSLAAALKISPVLLGLIFLFDRQYRAIAAAMVGGLTLTALSFAVTGAELHWVFLDRVRAISDVVAVMRVNYNLENLLFHLASSVTSAPFPTVSGRVNFPTPEPAWIGIVTKAFMIAGIAAVLWSSRRFDTDLRLQFRLTGLLIVTTLAAPLGWNHHYLPVLYLAPVLFCVAPMAQAALWLAAFTAINSMVAFSLLTGLDETYHWQAIAGTLSMIGLLVVIYVYARLRQPHVATGSRTTTPAVPVSGLNRPS